MSTVWSQNACYDCYACSILNVWSQNACYDCLLTVLGTPGRAPSAALRGSAIPLEKYRELATSCFESCRLIGAIPDLANALAPQISTQPLINAAISCVFARLCCVDFEFRLSLPGGKSEDAVEDRRGVKRGLDDPGSAIKKLEMMSPVFSQVAAFARLDAAAREALADVGLQCGIRELARIVLAPQHSYC